MPKNYESTISKEFSDEPTEYDKKCEELIFRCRETRLSPEDFSDYRNYSDEDISKARDILERKYASREYTENDDILDKTFEGVLYFAGNREQIFNRPCFSEPGSEFDDECRGVDVIFGFPQSNGEHDIVFNIDACTATNFTSREKDKIAEKFSKTDQKAWSDTPGCNKIEFYSHGKTHTRISQSPHYVVGVMPSKVQKTVNENLTFSENTREIGGAIDDNMRKKILLEIYFQSRAGAIACENVEKKTDRTVKAYKSHKAIEGACLQSLFQAFGVNTKEEGSEKKINEEIEAFLKSNREGKERDETFDHVCHEALIRLNQQRAIKKARAAAKAAKNTGSIRVQAALA